MSLSRTSKQFLQSVFGAHAAQATVEWWTFGTNAKGKAVAVGRQAARAAGANPAATDSVYWSVGLMKPGCSRSNANVEKVMALVADDVGSKVDRGLVDMFMPEPTGVVETSSGNCQYVWAIAGGMSVDEHRALWAGMEGLLGQRMDGSDPSHLFRLPEGVNGKPGKVQDTVTLVANSGRTHDFAYLRGLMLTGAPQGSGGSGGGATATVAQVESALKVLPNDGVSDWSASRKAWIDMGMAIKGALGDEGLDVWMDWCGAQPQEEDPADVWEGLNPHSIGWGFIEILAKKHGGGALAADVFDDGTVHPVGGAGHSLDQFWAHAPSGKFIDTVTGEMCPAVSVDAILPGEVYTDAAGKTRVRAASKVLRRDRTVNQLSWVPGKGQVLEATAVVDGGVVAAAGKRVFNLYKGPRAVAGTAQMSLPWTAHVRRLYPHDCEHIFDWFAHRVQFPSEKINHALVLGGDPGVGKDTLIEPLVGAVGWWNFSEVRPAQLMERFNSYKQAVVLRVNEVHDLGEGQNRVKFYNTMKTLVAAPPQTLQVERKGIEIYSIPNVVGVIMTTNHKLDGLYLPDNDRRHYVAWSKAAASDFKGGYFSDLWTWLQKDGAGHVAAFLRERDLRRFDAKAPPLKTRAFRSIAAVSRGGSNEAVADTIEGLGRPDVFSWGEFMNKAPGELHDMAKANSRKLAGCIEQEGYEKIDNPANGHGRWRVGDGWARVYGRRDMTVRDQLAAAERWATKKAADSGKFGA